MIAVSHAVLAGTATERLNAAPVDKIFATDSIPRVDSSPDVLETVSIAPLLAKAIRSIHRSESVSLLFE